MKNIKIKLALLSIKKNKAYAIYNTIGLTTGITCCLMIFQYVSHEKSYDIYNKQSDQIVRLQLDQYERGSLSWQSAKVYPAIAPQLQKDFPEVEKTCRLKTAQILLSNEAKNIKFTENKGYYADSSAFDILQIILAEGDINTALSGDNRIIISQKMAAKYFGKEDPINKTLTFKNRNLIQNLKITGIFKDYPDNSHLKINYLISYVTCGNLEKMGGDTQNSTETSWGWNDFYTYLKLKQGTNHKKFELKLIPFCNRYINNTDWYKNNDTKNYLKIINLRDIHLYSNSIEEAEINGNGSYIYFMLLIAVLVITIAWINYTNLATTRSLERAKEVGIRKLLGASRLSLISQFFIESLISNIIALFLAIILCYLLYPYFSQYYYNQQESIKAFSLPLMYWLSFLLIFVTGSFLSAFYPALTLSSYTPLKVLKGAFKNTPTGILLRKILIVTQFTVAIMLISGTAIIYQQLKFMRSRSLGFNLEQTIVLKAAISIPDSNYHNEFETFKKDLLQIPPVQNITASRDIMGQELSNYTDVELIGSEKTKGKKYSAGLTMYNINVDYDFIPNFEIKLLTGRNFSRDFLSDKKTTILNEEAIRELGFQKPEEAINQLISGVIDSLKIIGVMTNYHHQGMQKKILPIYLMLKPNNRGFYSIKISPKNIGQTINSIEKIWNSTFPSDPFEYFFLDDKFNEQYKGDQNFGEMFGLFSVLTIIIACIGLLSLSSYNIQQRVKEIVIRKVLGASIPQLILTLSKNFIYLIVLALFIAIPATWWIMTLWLRQFEFRTNINFLDFIFSGLSVIIIALVTISYQTIKASVNNPVTSLRVE